MTSGNTSRKTILLILFICLLIITPLIRSAAGSENVHVHTSYNYTDRLIVKYRSSEALQAMAADKKFTDFAVNNRIRKMSWTSGLDLKHFRLLSPHSHVLILPKRMTNAEANAVAQILQNDPDVEYAEPDRRIFPLIIPNDPQYANQWHYKSPVANGEPGGVNLPDAWDITKGSANVVIGIIDTGIIFSHADIVGRTVAGYNFISDPLMAGNDVGRSADASDLGDWITSAESNNCPSGPFCGCTVKNSSWHGTHIAGTIAASTNNSVGVSGINWISNILPVRVLGKCGGYTSDAADGINWAAGLPVSGAPLNANPAKVINLSFGYSGSCSPTLQSAINNALATGAVIVVAAGNDNANLSRNPVSPANCSNVITVAATTRSGGRASYSNYGSIIKIAAPGGSTSVSSANGILSTSNSGLTTPTASPAGDIYRYYQGTSMAAPHVSGIASLILSVNQALTPSQVLSRIQSTARTFPVGTGLDCTTSICGAGIIDAQSALSIANPVPAINSLNPSSATAGQSAFTLTVNGSNFISASTVRWNNSPRATTYVSVTQLQAAVTATDISNTGTAAITVVNPAPGGGTSASLNFSINNPEPAINSLSPSSATAGQSAFTLTVNGSNFISASTVRWNNSPRATTYVSATQLQAAVTATDISNAGTAAITVVNPAPGGGTSASLNFSINNPLPAINSLSPSSATAGQSAFTLTVNGSNFISASTVRWNNSPRTTTYVSATQLQAAVTATDISNAGAAAITVVNPAPGGGSSSALSFTINEPPQAAGGGGGGCFIATAAFGSPAETHVQILKVFRDRYLLDSVAGRAFVKFYYFSSPPVAQWIGKNELLRASTRLMLMPFIGIAYLIVSLETTPTLFFSAVIMLFILIVIRNLRKFRFSN